VELKNAVALIKKGIPSGERQRWADLGAGSGTFTQALATLLKEGSVIHAVDKDQHALNQIPSVEGREIIRIAGDIQHIIGTLNKPDGIIMANALHYIANQETFISHLKNHLVPGGRLVIVEYDMDTANSWIPYPVSFKNLEKMIAKTAFTSVERIGETASRYQKAGLYAAIIK
jgi:trans-aconitate methyltransferase